MSLAVDSDKPKGRACGAYSIGDELLTQEDGDLQCVAKTRANRRCRNLISYADLSDCYYNGAMVIPGVGKVSVETLGEGGPDEIDRAMRQLCHRHYPGPGEEVETVADPGWVPFDLVAHASAIEPGPADLEWRHWVVWPGMEEIARQVAEYAATQARAYALTLLPPELVASMTAAGIVGEVAA